MAIKILNIFKKISLISIVLITSFACQKLSQPENQAINQASMIAVKSKPIENKVYDLPQAKIHTLLIPADSQFEINIAVSQTLETVEEFAQKNQALAVINGGFFDPINQQTTSYIIQQGKIIADPAQNSRLMENPKLTSLLEKILNRSEFRQYQCETKITYAIAFHQDPIPANCQLLQAIGGGPKLLPELTAETEGFFSSIKGQVIRDPLGIERANARTAIGITKSGDIIWVMVAQKSSSSGLSLLELREFLKTLGITEAINLDGGSSSSFFHKEKAVYGKIGQDGELIKRPVKSVLILKENPKPPH